MITAQNNQLTITDWTITDSDIVRFFAEIETDNEVSLLREREELLLRALKIGVFALQRAQTRVDIDVIRREFDALRRQVEDTLDAIFGEDQGKLTLALNTYLGEGGKLANLFDPDRKESATWRIQAIFDEHFGGDGAKFARLLDYNESDSPLNKLHSAFEQRFKELREQLTVLRERLAAKEARTDERELGPQKGFDFEDLLSPILDRAARPFKDVVSLVSATSTDGRSKKGDLLVEVNKADTGGQDAYILIEAKREKGKAIAGKTGILQDMEEAMGRRKAQFAITVFSDDACPAEVGRLRAYTNNRIICSISRDGSDSLALEMAYHVARADLCCQLRHDGRGIDQAKVRETVKYAEEKLRQFQGLKSNATYLKKLAGDIRDQLDEIENDIRSALRDILDELETERDTEEVMPTSCEV